MNILKPFIAIALANAILMIFIVGWGPQIKNVVLGTQISMAVMPSSTPPQPTGSPVPTSTPRRRIVKVVRKPADLPQQGVNTIPAPVSQNNPGATAPTSAPQPQADNPQPTSPPQPPPDTRCLIQIDGSTYDVSAFRSMHSGGNIFTCGADMSQIFWGQHGQNTLNQMAKYKV